MLPDEKRDYEMYVHERMLQQFARKPSFRLAREIWLSGQDHNLKVPEELLSVFVEGIRKQVPEKTYAKGRRATKKGMFRGEVQKELNKQLQMEKRGAITRTCDIIAEQTEKSTEEVRQLIHRMKKKT